MASCDIRARLDVLDEALKAQRASDEPDEPKLSQFQFQHVYLGARTVTSVDGLLLDAGNDQAFNLFNTRLAACVNRFRRSEGKNSIQVNGEDKVSFHLCSSHTVS